MARTAAAPPSDKPLRWPVTCLAIPAMPHPSRSAQRTARLASAILLALLASCPAEGAAADACSNKTLRASAARRQDYPGDPLASSGVWVEVVRYGSAWKPCGVAADWRPYFHGSWTWTERGWFWVSQEPWGWLTYHYGRWLYDVAQGWVWLPGKIWAPAWVAWRWNDEFVGWAPLEPRGSGYSAFWTFVPAERLAGEQVEAVAIPGPRVPALLLKTRPSRAAAPGAERSSRGGWGGAGSRLSRR